MSLFTESNNSAFADFRHTEVCKLLGVRSMIRPRCRKVKMEENGKTIDVLAIKLSDLYMITNNAMTHGSTIYNAKDFTNGRIRRNVFKPDKECFNGWGVNRNCHDGLIHISFDVCGFGIWEMLITEKGTIMVVEDFEIK